MQKRQTWLNPKTGEHVQLSFDGVITRLERPAQITELSNQPWNEAAAIAEARESMKSIYEWSPHQVQSWRGQLIGMNLNDIATAKTAFLATGLPLKLWNDIDAYQRLIGYLPSPEPNQPMTMPEGGASVMMVEAGQTVPQAPDGTTIIRIDDPALKDSLLFHPTVEMKTIYEQLYLQVNVGVSPPPADQNYNEEARKLKADGWIRMSALEGDKKIFLPPPLTPFRPQLERSIKPMVRLAADKSRRPKAWDSKIGGVPYRPLGKSWPVTLDEASTPLIFLAQINYAQMNPKGLALPDQPSEGILQIYIFNTYLYGMPDESLTKLNPEVIQRQYRVIFYTNIIEDQAALDANVPPVVNPSEFIPHDTGLEIALVGIPDKEPVTAGDHGAAHILGIDVNNFEDVNAQKLREFLYDISIEGHKLGGYPNFTQSDPRTADDNSVLLLQIDSDQAAGIMWGDVGIANFFISPADLNARDFSRANFHWDCG